MLLCTSTVLLIDATATGSAPQVLQERLPRQFKLFPEFLEATCNIAQCNLNFGQCLLRGREARAFAFGKDGRLLSEIARVAARTLTAAIRTRTGRQFSGAKVP